MDSRRLEGALCPADLFFLRVLVDTGASSAELSPSEGPLPPALTAGNARRTGVVPLPRLVSHAGVAELLLVDSAAPEATEGAE